MQENNLNFRKILHSNGKSLNILIENVTLKDSLYIAQGFDEYYNKMQITSKKPILKDTWIKIENFNPRMDKNYAEI